MSDLAIEIQNREQLEKDIKIQLIGSTIFDGDLNILHNEGSLRALTLIEDLV